MAESKDTFKDTFGTVGITVGIIFVAIMLIGLIFEVGQISKETEIRKEAF